MVREAPRSTTTGVGPSEQLLPERKVRPWNRENQIHKQSESTCIGFEFAEEAQREMHLVR